MIECVLERVSVSSVVASAARRVATPATVEGDPGRARIRTKVLAAFLAEDIAESDLRGSFGYGYDDPARERYESLLARILGAERVLARLSLVSGTHAIVTMLSACVAPGQTLVSATGRPYDTLRNAIVDAPHALVAQGIRYEEIALRDDGVVDLEAVALASEGEPAAVFVQRSRGYAVRPSLSAADCGAVARAVKAISPATLVVVDNCYGELVEDTEPTDHGADALAGSLLKNLGGGLAPGGAYIAGSAALIERVASRHYAPGLGSAVGPTLGYGRALIQGLFQAPVVVGEALAGLDWATGLFSELGFAVDPLPGVPRRDIVQAIRLGNASRLLAFARGLQQAMPVNRRFTPEPAPVPGYADPVIMSSGAFVPGATIELSCDAPLRAPYEVYLQGGTMREHVILGALCAAEALAQESLLPPAKVSATPRRASA